MIGDEGTTPKISGPRAIVFTVTSTWPALGATQVLRGVKPQVQKVLRSSWCTVRVPDIFVKGGKVTAVPVHNVKAYKAVNVQLHSFFTSTLGGNK